MGGVAYSQVCRNFPYAPLGSFNIGIHNNAQQGIKPLHINSYPSPETCSDPAIMLEYTGQPASYHGFLSLITPANNIGFEYSRIATEADMVLNPYRNANNLVLAALNKGRAIKFSTTPNIPEELFDIERFRISSDIYHTLIDIKIREMGVLPNQALGNGLLRFQITDIINGEPKTVLGGNWKIGIDRVNNIFNAQGEFQFGNWLKIGCNNSPNDFSNTFDYSNTAITINPNNNIVLGNPDFNYTSNPILAKVSIVNNDGSDVPALRVHRNLDGEYRHCLIDYVSTKVNQVKNPTFANTSNAFVIANDLNTIDWKEVFAVKGNGDTYIDGQVIISSGNGIFHKQQDHLNARLFVEGNIVAQEVYVTVQNWSDNVFQSNYNLISINDMEKSIKENGHLPGIPSEKEVMEKGLNLGDFQAKLLQKIEELTLYIIDLNKKNEILTNEIKILKNK